MSVLELLLAIYTAVGVLILAVWRGAGHLTFRLTAIAGGLLSLVVVALGKHRAESVPMTLAAVIVAVLAFRRSRNKTVPFLPRHRRFAAVLRYTAALLVVLVVMLNAAFIEFFDPLSNAPLMELFDEPETPDFSALTWPDAFEKLSDHLSRAYAIGEWKRIDWQSLHDVTAPKIAAASQSGNRNAYYVALREYLWSLNDGHVNLYGHDGGLRNTAVKGGFGLALIQLDDGRTVAYMVREGGPAGNQGMKWGATILEWNGIATADVAAQTTVLWYLKPPATNEGRRLAQLRLLTRMPVGTSATVVFQNPDEDKSRSVTLVAVDDSFELLRLDGRPSSWRPPEKNIDWRMLPEGIGYVRIYEEMPTLTQLLPDRVIRSAVAAFVRARAKGVVIDVRGNPGGADKLVPMIMGFFVGVRQFYEHTTYYDPTTSQFERVASGTLWTEPRAPNFAGPIAVLVDEWCMSSCEGFALVARRRAGGHVVGFHGTYGSFGMSGAEALMPDGITVTFPNGRSVDANGVVQIDSDWQLKGGVTPDIRVPITKDTVFAQYKGGQDVVLETAVRTLIESSNQQ
jgi:carboxyl-terminal processing protease